MGENPKACRIARDLAGAVASRRRRLRRVCGRTEERGGSMSAHKKTAALPVTIKITGELASRVREAAASVGIRPETFGRHCIRTGELTTAPDEKGRRYRREMALTFVEEALGQPVEHNRHA